ncbi:conserved Plasmodium protein, unknown function [Plasmodium gallinaceum]|uniref:Uncharacterized protein n=1 Tax=Plasmodium gallinaceum TaxID=5849 RepID=A0A1J1H2R0_PLAGA|nr:conserved Plasmodium protein, unknown function [Plasmodium gallinaceum]CRG97771.1 conserved Plasmodium protein, unknown function [Plasmodium gallinaceum]
MNESFNNNYLNNVYLEFNLFNNFLKELNEKIKYSNNENYTSIYDCCIENIYNIHNKFNEWNNNKEEIDDKFIEYFSQNFIFNIKTFLRNNFNIIDNNLEILKNKNKKLVEKLKLGLENAENQENYIYELEKSLKNEKEKNRNVNNLLDKINNLTEENEKLKSKNEQLELSSFKHKEENNKIKVELKKYISLYEKNKKLENKNISYNILNKKMSTLFKKINNDVQVNRNNKTLEKNRSYSFNFLHTLQSIMINDIKHSNDNNNNNNNKCKQNLQNTMINNNCSSNNKIENNDKKIHNLGKKIISYERINKQNDSFIHGENNKRVYHKKLTTYKIYNNSDITCTEESDNIYKNIEYINRKITKRIDDGIEDCVIRDIKLKNISSLNDSYFSRDNCYSSTTLLMDIKKTLRNNRIYLINSMLKKHIDKIEKKKKKSRKLLKLHQKPKLKDDIHNERDQSYSLNNMIIEDYRCSIYNFYECIKNDIRIILENSDNVNLDLFSNYSKNIIKEIHNEKNVLKKKKIDKITRKYLRQIDSYRLNEKDFFHNITKEENRNDKYFNLNYNKYDSFDLRKILKNNYQQQIFDSDYEEAFSFNIYENNDLKIIDRLKDLKSNISFYKLYDLIDFSNKK